MKNVKKIYLALYVVANILISFTALCRLQVYQGFINEITVEEAAAIAKELNVAMDMEHREKLEEIIRQALQKPNGRERIRVLQNIGRLAFQYPRYKRIVDIFKNLNLFLFYLTKTRVNVFGQLLPSVNLLLNYLNLLEEISTRENKKLFRRFRGVLRTALVGLGKELYGEAEFYRVRGNVELRRNRLLVAQGVLYKIKETDSEAEKLFETIDKKQQVPFKERLQRAGFAASGVLLTR